MADSDSDADTNTSGGSGESIKVAMRFRGNEGEQMIEKFTNLIISKF